MKRRLEQAAPGTVQSREELNDAQQHQRVTGKGVSKWYSWDLVSVKALPDFLRDNEYLLNSHRPQLNTSSECCKSIIRLHTETCNIWTHLLGCIGVIILSTHYLYFYTTGWTQFITFGIFFGGATFCLAASTLFHTLLCHSEAMFRNMAKLDYCGVILLISTSGVPWIHYAFYCHAPVVSLFYIITIVVIGCVCLFAVLDHRFSEARFRTARAGLFVMFGLTGVAPSLHYMLTTEPTHHNMGHVYWALFMATCYISGAAIFASRIPERISPGTFDIWCHSHQILHLCVIGGILCTYVGATEICHQRLSAGTDACLSYS